MKKLLGLDIRFNSLFEMRNCAARDSIVEVYGFNSLFEMLYIFCRVVIPALKQALFQFSV